MPTPAAGSVLIRDDHDLQGTSAVSLRATRGRAWPAPPAPRAVASTAAHGTQRARSSTAPEEVARSPPHPGADRPRTGHFDEPASGRDAAAGRLRDRPSAVVSRHGGGRRVAADPREVLAAGILGPRHVDLVRRPQQRQPDGDRAARRHLQHDQRGRPVPALQHGRRRGRAPATRTAPTPAPRRRSSTSAHLGCAIPPNADTYWVGDAGPGPVLPRRPGGKDHSLHREDRELDGPQRHPPRPASSSSTRSRRRATPFPAGSPRSASGHDDRDARRARRLTARALPSRRARPGRFLASAAKPPARRGGRHRSRL